MNPDISNLLCNENITDEQLAKAQAYWEHQLEANTQSMHICERNLRSIQKERTKRFLDYVNNPKKGINHD